MVFHSLPFLVFFPTVVILFYLFPHKTRKIFLLTAGYFFYYCFKPEYLLLLIAATTVDYYIGKRIQKNTSQKVPQTIKKYLLSIGIVGNVGLLFLFKYLNLFTQTFNDILNPLNLGALPQFKWLLPVGISYYTFKKISYLIDVYRGTINAEKKWLDFALYVSFFPQIMAGPIDRAGKLIPQFSRENVFIYHNAVNGLKRIAWGFFKKLVIADHLALFVDKVYTHPQHYDGLSLIVATIYFSIQIYCDFSGYTDIAVGTAQIMGYELTENFNRPYFAQSIGQFWKRWHISLTSWLMDYLFLPIAYRVSAKIKSPRLMNIKAEVWAYMAGISITMLLCGIWHGAGWTFVIWGALHGLFMALALATKRLRKKMNKTIILKRFPDFSRAHALFRILITFSLVSFAWIFFRAASPQDAFYIVTHLFNHWPSLIDTHSLFNAFTFGLPTKELAVALFSTAFMVLMEFRQKDIPFTAFINKQHPLLRWTFYIILVLWIIVFAQTGAPDFIYFRF